MSMNNKTVRVLVCAALTALCLAVLVLLIRLFLRRRK